MSENLLANSSQASQMHLDRLATKPGMSVPGYVRSEVSLGWVHIGCGAFHRAHQALALDSLLNSDFASHKNWGLCGVNLLSSDSALCEALNSQDGLYSLLERDDTSENLKIIGSLKKVLHASKSTAEVMDIMSSPDVKLITLTVTESGYYFDIQAKQLMSDQADIQHDLKTSEPPITALGLLARVLLQRWKLGVPAPTILSCDNLKENGSILRSALIAFCELFDPALAEYIRSCVKLPSSMVDRITPRLTEPDRVHIQDSYGIDDRAPVVSEKFWQWVIEDDFGIGRPAFENLPGVILTNDVRPYEDMKLRLLNAGHTQCGYLGYLMGYTLIDQVARDPLFRKLLTNFWDDEVIPNLPSVTGINFANYTADLLARFSNHNLGDQTVRICLDGSAKMLNFVLPSVRDGLRLGTPIEKGCLCVAAWIRFCSGVTEDGNTIEIKDTFAEDIERLGLEIKNSPNNDIAKFLIGMPQVFGDLAQNKKFIATVQKWVSNLYLNGARATLEIALS